MKVGCCLIIAILAIGQVFAVPWFLLWAYHMFQPVFGWQWPLTYWHLFVIWLVISLIAGAFKTSVSKS